MIGFQCDYMETAHERVLEKLAAYGARQFPGYGEDEVCARAAAMIRQKAQCENTGVHFLVGGTQVNMTVIAAALRPHQGVLSAQTGHINVHESGAIEATGHKVLALPSGDGKLTGAQIREAVRAHRADEAFEHMVQPAMVYISDTTEVGTVYTKAELMDVSSACRDTGLLLYLDGARLGYALTCEGSDVQLSDLARLCDAFTIGGTKQGALFGEALVITNDALARDFRYILKQKGGMLAKGWLLGAQFEALMEDDLYFTLAARANALALSIRDAFRQKGVRFLADSPSNQQFPILKDEDAKRLARKYSFSTIRVMDGGMTCVRFCASWATEASAVDALCRDIAALPQD